MMKPLVSVIVDSLMLVQIVEDAQRVTPETPTVEIADLQLSVPNREATCPAIVTEHVNKEVNRLSVPAMQASLTTVLSSAESAQILSLSILTVN